MKKQFFSVIALLLVAQVSFANVITGVAKIPDGYYDGIDGKSSANTILDALFSKIKNHTVIGYDNLEPYYEKTDFTGDTVWDMYSTCRFTYDEANKSQSAVCDGWNKEHSIPQSWFSKQSPMKSDLFHVYPTDARVNNFRSNNPYGEVNGATGTGITKNTGNHARGKVGSNTFSGYTGKVYEPDDEFKGDFARTYFYMVARYRDRALNSSEGSAVFTSNKTNLTDYAKNLFLKWHRQDPVSQKEIDRNEAVYGIQKNRNPFIDYPELAEYIWGDRVGQTIDLSTMTPTCEGGGGGGTTPPVVTIKYGVTWSVNGEVLNVDSVVKNQKPQTIPATPTSCSTESETFMGWTNAAIDGIAENAPAVLYTKVAEFPAVTADVTYYAVFAHEAVEGGAAPVTYTYDEQHTSGWTNTASKNNGYWILNSAGSLVSPEVDLSGLSSIQMTVRTYGGTSNNTVSISAGGKTIGTIKATSNSLAEQTWTNTAQLSGKSEITFSADYATGKGVGFSSVTINATGKGIEYTRYITTCQESQEVDLVSLEGVAKKILVGGKIYILLNDQLFTITGQKIK